jgi:hypothetical protein
MNRPENRAPVAAPFRPPAFILLPSAFILLFTGCARYEYDVLEPRQLAGHVGTKGWVSLRRQGDLEYLLRTADNRLVMLIHNRGDATLKLLADDSVVVDPAGESRPVAGATLVPGSHVKRIFPPPRPRVGPYGPTIGIGVGAAYGSGHGHYHHGHHHHGYYGAGYDMTEPRYYTVYDPNDRTYFDWPGGTSVRLLLTFQREGAENVRHEFLIRRTKM